MARRSSALNQSPGAKRIPPSPCIFDVCRQALARAFLLASVCSDAGIGAPREYARQQINDNPANVFRKRELSANEQMCVCSGCTTHVTASPPLLTQLFQLYSEPLF